MKISLIITGIAALGLAAAGSAMVVSDNQIEQALEQLKSQSSAQINIEVIEDDGSFFNRQVNLKINESVGNQIIVGYLNNRIQNRPWGTTIYHELSFDNQIAESIDNDELKQLTIEKLIESPFLTGTTSIGLTGSYDSDWVSLSLDETINGYKTTLSPWSLNFNGDTNKNIEILSVWPGMEVIGESETGKLNNIKLGQIDFSAKGQYVGGMTIIGDQSLKGSGLSVLVNDFDSESSFELNSYTMVQQSQVEKDEFSASSIWKTENINFNDSESNINVEDLVFNANVSGLKFSNLQNISNALNSMRANTGMDSDALKEDANSLLKNGFSLSITEISAMVDGKQALLSAKASLPKNDVADISNPMSLMALFPTLTANANISIDSAIANNPEFSEQFFGLMMMGILVEKEGKYVLDASLENGAAMLNGNLVPLPF